MSELHIISVEKNTPFGDYLYSWLHLSVNRNLATVSQLSGQFERPYLAWEIVRKGRNPYFENGTGFEGYFIGQCSSADEALHKLIAVGEEMRQNLFRLYHFDLSFHSKLMRTIMGESADPRAIFEWATEFGAELARLRCNYLRNQEADKFRTETYRLSYALPPINYHEDKDTIRQQYAIYRDSKPSTKEIINPKLLKPAEQDAWVVVQSIGKFGHPLLREFLHFNSNGVH
ncbi:MAG: hypothetical protein KF726_23940 [Anaerolineae bacterium]|nr:hypothetical protein [Anaerolineae bacterium]